MCLISSVQKLEKDFYPLVAFWKIISPRGSFSGYSGAFFFLLSCCFQCQEWTFSSSCSIWKSSSERLHCISQNTLVLSVTRTVMSSLLDLLFEVCVPVAACSALILVSAEHLNVFIPVKENQSSTSLKIWTFCFVFPGIHCSTVLQNTIYTSCLITPDM